MNAEMYMKVLEQHMLPSRWRLFHGRPCVFQQDNAKPHTAEIITSWPHSRRDRVLNWSVCSPDLSHLAHHQTKNTTTNSSTAVNLYQARMGPNSNTKTPETHNLDVQIFLNCFEKKRRCYTMVNMPLPNYFETCSRHQIWNELILCILISQFKHVLCYLCSILYKILAHVIWNSFSIRFSKKKKKKTFRNSGCLFTLSILQQYLYQRNHVFFYSKLFSLHTAHFLLPGKLEKNTLLWHYLQLFKRRGHAANVKPLTQV